MSNGLFDRWSRRKRAAQIEAPPAESPLETEGPELELPLVETLGATSDYTAFLQKGVSVAIQQQALRRAWESDASIASFRGMADYDWDFNAPTYGRLWPTDDVAKLLREVLALPPEPEPEPERLTAQALPAEAPTPDVHTLDATPEPTAVTSNAPEPSSTAHRHGSALPS